MSFPIPYPLQPLRSLTACLLKPNAAQLRIMGVSLREVLRQEKTVPESNLPDDEERKITC